MRRLNELTDATNNISVNISCSHNFYHILTDKLKSFLKLS